MVVSFLATAIVQGKTEFPLIGYDKEPFLNKK